MFQRKKRIGVIGFGSLGQYLVSKILSSNDLELAFVWNRNQDVVKQSVDNVYILNSLDDIAKRQPDLVIEVAHPDITERYGAAIVDVADYMIGSPAALAKKNVEDNLKLAASRHGVYIPSGALWGAEDIRKMADGRTLQKLAVTMAFHPSSLKLVGHLKTKNAAVTEKTILYEGTVRELCEFAPNNVNTMAAAAIAAHNLGFDETHCCLISDPSLTGWHVVDIEVHGRPSSPNGSALHIHTVRRNPAYDGQVTGSATFAAFFSSIMRAGSKGPGIHLC